VKSDVHSASAGQPRIQCGNRQKALILWEKVCFQPSG
jgi:hypothetical protein